MDPPTATESASEIPLVDNASATPLIAIRDAPQHWGYVIVMPKVPENNRLRGAVTRRVREAGLTLRKCLSRDRDEAFFYITASDQLLEMGAETMELSWRVLPDHGGGYMPYEISKRDAFEPFTSLAKQRILRFLIESPHFACLDIKTYIQKDIFISCFPLHLPDEVEALNDEWFRGKIKFLPVPLDSVRAYFGEKLALYFLYLQTYIFWLVGPALLGLIATIIRLTVNHDKGNSQSVFAVIIAIWSVAFYKGWKRTCARNAYRWNMLGYEEAERTRPAFKGEPKAGIYTRGGFVELNEPRFAWHKELYEPPKSKYLKYLSGAPLFMVIITVVIVGTIAILWYRTQNATFGMFSGIINGMFIVTFNIIYNFVAIKLTDWENHRTETEYEDALIVKKFAFQFVNSYISLFYIAFFKSTGIVPNSSCMNDDCAFELGYQLLFIFAVQIIWGQFAETGLPWIISRLKIKHEDYNLKKQLGTTEVAEISNIEGQAKLSPYTGLMDDYNELMIQLGYVTLFTAAFPLAPLAALINNLIEVRTDAIKYMWGTQRPYYQGAEDLGSWGPIMNFMTVCSVLTNMGVILWTSDVWDLEVVIIVEHFIFALRFLIDNWISDIPDDLVREISKQEFLRRAIMNREQAIQEFKAQQHDIRRDEAEDSDHYEDNTL